MTKKIDDNFNAGKYYTDSIEQYIRSKGTQKMWNYFLDITKKDYFVEAINKLRQKYNIPLKGFEPDEDGHYYTPPKGFTNDEALREDIVEKICKKYGLHYFDFSDVLLHFVYHNQLQTIYELGACGLFRVVDVIGEKEDPYGELFQQGDDMAYPIAIRISPYASQRDLIDFIKNKAIWKLGIEALQNKYKADNIKIGKVKSKNEATQNRNDFIYENRHLPLKKIFKLVSDKFNEVLDDGHISKIISLEKQKRKDV